MQISLRSCLTVLGNENGFYILLQNTSSGSVCCNDVIVQLSVETLPFGGIGESGYGSYHGKLGQVNRNIFVFISCVVQNGRV